MLQMKVVVLLLLAGFEFEHGEFAAEDDALVVSYGG